MSAPSELVHLLTGATIVSMLWDDWGFVGFELDNGLSVYFTNCGYAEYCPTDVSVYRGKMKLYGEDVSEEFLNA